MLVALFFSSIIKKIVQITEEHWKNFADILEVLEPLKSATEIMSGDRYPSLNMVVPAYVAITDHLERWSSSNDGSSMYTESDFKVDASKAALMKLAKYLLQYFVGTLYNRDSLRS